MILLLLLICILMGYFAIRNYFAISLLGIIIRNEGISVDEAKMSEAKQILTDRFMKKLKLYK